MTTADDALDAQIDAYEDRRQGRDLSDTEAEARAADEQAGTR